MRNKRRCRCTVGWAARLQYSGKRPGGRRWWAGAPPLHATDWQHTTGGVAGSRGGVLLLVQLWSAGHESGGALHGDLHFDVTCAPLACGCAARLESVPHSHQLASRSMYHATVCLRPSLKLISGFQPSASSLLKLR